MSYLLRVVLPDRPGALGAVATALGRVEADILSVDIVERGHDGRVTDDIVVDLPTERLPDGLVSAAAAVPGVTVESIRPYAGRIDPHRELELLDALAAQPDDALQLLVDGVARIFRAGWAIALQPGSPTVPAHVLARSTAAPEEGDDLPTPWWPPHPARVLDLGEDGAGWAPKLWADLATELAVCPLGGDALLVGRPTLRWLPSELMRMQHLAGIAATVAQLNPRG